MATGIWTAVSGASAQAQAVDTIANNLANVDTLGFKKDRQTFKEYLAAIERDPGVPDVPRGPIKDKEFYPLDGRDQAFVVNDGTYTDFRQGNLRVTQRPLDVALDGPGFLEVSTPNGVRYTRQGSLKIAKDGKLVTPEGYPVLSSQPGGLASALPAAPVQPGQGRLDPTQGGVGAGPTPEVLARVIDLRDRQGPITINGRGELRIGDQLVARLSVTEFRDLNQLRKSAGQLFESADVANIETTEGEQTEIRQGVLETSNVNPAEEMVNLIKAQRNFEHDLKALKTYGDLLGREANDIGKL